MNTDAIITALIGALPPTIVAGLALYQAIKTHRQSVETHKSVNGMKHDLVESVRKEASAQATLDEKGEQKKREGEAAVATLAAVKEVSNGAPVTEAERAHDRATLIKDRD